ncbi:polysaccharide deacetylase family protein [Nonomuraea sp. NPDC000554]|uniref:polysaccharide deacetylase family protein n=1 Tax=Nonomuraea sp. NPDC000554 TaxID=3154259 RepID=UPI00332564B9
MNTPEGKRARRRWLVPALAVTAALAKERVRATFFVIGSQVEAHPEYAKRLVAAGHELGNHTYTHRRMVFVSPDTVAAEVEPTNALIRQAGQRGEIPSRLGHPAAPLVRRRAAHA